VLAARARALDHWDPEGPTGPGWRRRLLRPNWEARAALWAPADLSAGNILANREDDWSRRVVAERNRLGKRKPVKGEGKRTKKRK